MTPTSDLLKVRSDRMKLFLIVNVLLFLPSLVLFAINGAVSFGLLGEDFPLYWVGADRSMTSTLVFVLAFLFPYLRALKYLRDVSVAPQSATASLEESLYPKGFVFFLVMLGLAGTLYGMIIAMDSNAIREATVGNDANATRSVINNLMVGLATAVLSSLWALVAAFVAACPIAMFYTFACALPKARLTGDAGLMGTVRQLTSDLHKLGIASRMAQQKIETGSVTEEQLAKVEAFTFAAEEIQALRASTERTNDLLQSLLEVISQQAQSAAHDRRALKAALAPLVQPEND